MQTAHKLILVGIGYRPLETRAKDIVRHADVILASSRLLEVFKRYDEYTDVRDRITVIDKVPEMITFIAERLGPSSRLAPDALRKSIVLLASGDPFFFGIGRRMIKEFGNERIEVIPDLSSMQEAFSRIKVPWDDAFCISVHGGPDIAKRRALPYDVADIPTLLDRHGKIAILTDRVNNPNLIAKTLEAFTRDASGITMHVCEHLGYDDEQVRSGTVEQLSTMTFADPNVVILLNDRNGKKSEVVFGLKEDDISHARGLITKDEVRAVAIHKLRLPVRGVLWDIGAGSGSVSIEAAKICPGLNVMAIEREEEQLGHIRANVAKFRAGNVEVVHGKAMDVVAGLPAPDRVFIGGSGGQIEAIIEHCSTRMRSGIIVVNAITLDTLNLALAALERAGFSVSLSEVSVSRSRTVAGKRQMTAQNPIFIVTGEKSEHAG